MKRLLMALTAVGLAACVQTSTKMVDSRTAIISGLGGSVVPMSDVMHKVLIEAAQTTKAHGYDCFAVLGARDASRSGAVAIPGNSYTSGTASSFGPTTTFNATTTSTPGYMMPYVQPGADIVIKMYYAAEVPDGAEGVWKAEDILAAQEDASRKK